MEEAKAEGVPSLSPAQQVGLAACNLEDRSAVTEHNRRVVDIGVREAEGLPQELGVGPWPEQPFSLLGHQPR